MAEQEVNIYNNKCKVCGKLIPANLPMNDLCASCSYARERELPEGPSSPWDKPDKETNR